MQEKLLQKREKFQCSRITVTELMSAGSAAANFLPPGTLLEENEFMISDPLFITNAYNENYYIDTTLRFHKYIQEGIFFIFF